LFLVYNTFMPALEVKNLKKYFSNKNWWQLRKKPVVIKAVDDISFTIGKGEIVGLLGPNGAGKTTTTQMLLGTLTPSSGEIFYFGQKFNEHNKEVLKRTNFCSAYIGLPHRITVWENLAVYARLYEVKNIKERIEKFLKEFEVWPLRNKAINQLSAGQKTRVLLAKAFLNHPEILLLDEPTASLDPDIAVKVRKFLLEQQKEYKVAMLFTSHNMHEVQEICDRIIFLNKGKIIYQDTPTGLIRKLKKAKVKMVVIKAKDILERYLKAQKIKFYWRKRMIIFRIDEEIIPKALYQLSDRGVRYDEIEILRPTLEDFFLEVANK